MKKRKKEIGGNPGMTNGEVWLQPVAAWGEPRRRSFPYEPTRLEILATRMGIDDEALRELLQGEIQRRLAERELADDRREA